MTKKKYQEALDNIGDKNKFESSLRSLLRTIEPFDINLFRQLIHKYEEESVKVKDQEVFLLIGPTGAGKSTTCHYLAGSKMKIETLETDYGKRVHIQAFVDGVADKSIDENLKEVEISGIMKSCTRFIKPIKINHIDEDDE